MANNNTKKGSAFLGFFGLWPKTLVFAFSATCGIWRVPCIAMHADPLVEGPGLGFGKSCPIDRAKVRSYINVIMTGISSNADKGCGAILIFRLVFFQIPLYALENVHIQQVSNDKS